MTWKTTIALCFVLLLYEHPCFVRAFVFCKFVYFSSFILLPAGKTVLVFIMSQDGKPALVSDTDPDSHVAIAVVEFPDANSLSVPITLPGKRESSPPSDTPTAKVPKSNSGKNSAKDKENPRSSSKPSKARQPDIASLVATAVAAAIPPHVLEILSLAAANPAVMALSTTGEDSRGRLRSAPSSTVTSAMLADSGRHAKEVTQATVRADDQFTGSDFGGGLLLCGHSQPAGMPYPTPSQAPVSTYSSLGLGRPDSRHGLTHSILERAGPRAEGDAVLSLAGVQASDQVSLPAQSGSALPPRAGSRSTQAGNRPTSAQELASGGNVGGPSAFRPPPAIPWGTQAQAAGTPQAVPLAQQVAPAHPPPPPPIDGAAPVGEFDDDSQLDDSSSLAGTDAQADTDLSARPYQEILQIISEFHPEMIVRQDAPASVTSLFGARLSAATEQAPTLKAVQSPLITSSVEAVLAQLRGPASATCASSGLTTFPNGAKPGKFVKPRAPSFLKDGFTEGNLPHLPPPTTPSDLAVTSASPGQTASVSVAQLMTLESSVLSALDLASLGDLSTSALACAIFEPGSADFKEDTDPVQVWRMLQFLDLVQRSSARILANVAMSLLLQRRDHVLAAAPCLSPELQTALRLAPVVPSSLFGQAAQAAASVSSQENQQRAFEAVVSLASSHAAKGSRGHGAHSKRGRGNSAASSNSTPSGRAQRGRGSSRGRGRGGKGKGSNKPRQAPAAQASGSQQQNPQ